MPFKFDTTPERSRNMAAIRSRGNATTEQMMVKLLRKHGITGWRRHLDLPGRPDFAFPREKVAVFVDGCFWHFCPRCSKIPKRNQEYWAEKARRNKARDRKVSRELRAKGWRVIRIWEHGIVREGEVVTRIQRALALGRPSNT